VKVLNGVMNIIIQKLVYAAALATQPNAQNIHF
jgi:hypothetical protein